jgi:hypothetical protein
MNNMLSYELVCAGAAEDRRRRLNLALGRDPIGEERS